MCSEEEKDSIWLYGVLESIGVKDEYRRTFHRSGITIEILRSVESLIISSNYGCSLEASETQLQNDGCTATNEKEYIICKFSNIFDNIVTFYSMGSQFEGTFTTGDI